TAPDYDEALHFYRDVLGLEELADFSSPDGQVTLLGAGRATLELTDVPNAQYVDRVEVGRRGGGHIPGAFEVDDARAATTPAAAGPTAAEAAGARVIAEPIQTSWDSLNARLEAPAGLQLTLFEELSPK